MRALLLAGVVLVPSTALAQDASKGEQVFRQCTVCHDIGTGARSKVGPPLNGILGLRAATATVSYAYSDALRASGIVWDKTTLGQYIANSRGRVPGTKMSFEGIKDESKVADLIAYLQQFDTSGKFTLAAPVMPDGADAATWNCIQSLDTAAAKDKCAAAGGELLQAIGLVVSTDSGAEGYGKFDGTALVDQSDEAIGRYFMRLKPSAGDPCVLEETHLVQAENDWASLVQSDYDFHKITRIRYLVNDSDRANTASAAETDPNIREIALEGAWICRDAVSLKPTDIKTGRTCDQGIFASASEPNGRAVLKRAVNVIARMCGVPK